MENDDGQSFVGTWANDSNEIMMTRGFATVSSSAESLPRFFELVALLKNPSAELDDELNVMVEDSAKHT